METKKINEVTEVTTMANGDKILSVNAGGAAQQINPLKMLLSTLSLSTEKKTPASSLYIPIFENNKQVAKVSIADLASVVSGVIFSNRNAVSDVNKINQTCYLVFAQASEISNLPSDFSYGGVLTLCHNEGLSKIQIATYQSNTSSRNIALRSCWYGVYGLWKTL